MKGKTMGSVKILVIEDDVHINRLICDSLKKEFFDVDSACDGKSGLTLLEQNQYQLVITDLLLPGLDGYEIIRRCRQNSKIPIIILSVKDSETDKIVGLRLGADDYMTKPFSVAELVERVKGHLRRYLNWSSSDEVEKILTHGLLSLNTQEYKAYVNGNEIDLTSREFEILRLLLEKPGRIYTKDQIYNRVWGADYYLDDNTITVHIRRLRKKIEPDPSNPQIIETVWGIGYRLR